MKGWIEEYAIIRKFIEKYCEEQDKNHLIEMLNMKDRFLFKYFVNEFSKLKIPNKMTEEELKEYKEKIMIYIFKKLELRIQMQGCINYNLTLG